jgi:hypothetical protein
MKYLISEIGEGRKYIPKEELEKKEEYEKLYSTILKTERKVKSDMERLKKLKSKLVKLKKERTRQYNELMKYHKYVTPTISITFSKTKKRRITDKNTFLNSYNELTTGGNKSWSISMRITGRMKNIYIGTTKNVCRRLDEIDGFEKWEEGNYSNLIPHRKKRDEKKIKDRIKELIIPNIIKELVDIRERDGNVTEFKKRKGIKGMGYLMELSSF